MIDFNKGVEKLNRFQGSEKKTTILFENELYMIKFPDPVRAKNNSLSYMNNQFSEHIGCQIFDACGFEVQETVLGFYEDKLGHKKLVVGCRDFTQDGSVLYEFSKLANAVVEVDRRLEASIENVHLVIDSSDLIENKAELKNRFWDMLIIDTLIGNADRHFDNWGVLERKGEINFAPIYDCGSSLSALFDDEQMSRILQNPTLFRNEEYNAKSCYTYQGKRIFYHEFFKRMPEELTQAVKRMVPLIDLVKIRDIITNTAEISDIRKNYLIEALTVRYQQILLPAHNGLLKH